jgi:hypothetical protein
VSWIEHERRRGAHLRHFVTSNVDLRGNLRDETTLVKVAHSAFAAA